MARVITFSRTFPAYHPKAGQPTHFVEKFWNSIYADRDSEDALMSHELGGIWSAWCEMRNVAHKHHTIRAGSRWKVGDKFSPRVWSGKPYSSKQIVIAPDTEVVKVWDFKLHGGNCFTSFKDYLNDDNLKVIAQNDGLSLEDLVSWFHNFSKQFDGQIICWNESVNY